jgi:hypothetical protein
MLADRLSKLWDERRRSSPIDTSMRFSEEGLLLGAGTVLAMAGASGRDIAIDPPAPRLIALLTAAHLREPAAGDLVHLRKAAEHWRAREDALALMHLSLSRLDRLKQPEADAQRLFLADGLLSAGIAADTVVKVIRSGVPALDHLGKFDPDQPRVPSGSGRTSGQWTSGNDASTASAEAPSSRPVSGAPEPEVNQNTVTQADLQQYETPYACHVAEIHCVDAAVEASEGDADVRSPNAPRNLDIDNCLKASANCTLLSVAIQLQPFPLGGGMIFPHGGVVRMSKGRVDRYAPPWQGGRPQLSRRSQAPYRGTSLRRSGQMENDASPPWSPGSDEKMLAPSDEFPQAKSLIESYCRLSKETVIEQRCSLSPRWGKIVRAKIATGAASSSAGLLTVWLPPGGAEACFDFRLDCQGCGGSRS